jgi:flagellar biosynthetic protein FlhB
MANEHDGIERTEAPSPRWVARARERGNWPRSRELVAACTLLAGVLAIRGMGGPLAQHMIECTRTVLSGVAVDAAEAPAQSMWGWRVQSRGVLPWLAAVLLVPAVAAIAAGVSQVGLRLRPELLLGGAAPTDRLSGLGQVFSLQRLGASLSALAKWTLLAAAAAWWLWSDLVQLDATAAAEPSQLARVAAAVLLAVATKLAIALVLLGLADYALAWWSWHRQMRPSRAELAAEMREAEGDPIARRRRRQVQLDHKHSRTDRLLQANDLVVVGRGRLAVAVRRSAPGRGVILARVTGPAAEHLRQIARHRGAVVVRDDATARSLWRAGRVGHCVSTSELDAVVSRTARRRLSDAAHAVEPTRSAAKFHLDT